MQAALVTAKAVAPLLIPYLIVDGVPNEYTAWFERNGGTVVMHKLSFTARLREVCSSSTAYRVC